jgi:hypothetical protein
MSDVLDPIIRKIEKRPAPRPDRIIVAIDRKSGKQRRDDGVFDKAVNAFHDVILYEITVDEEHWIENASTAIAIFLTNERSELTFRMLITARRENAGAIAEALYDHVLSPAQVLFRTVRTYVGGLLEQSSRHGPESVMERIAHNRHAWQTELEHFIAKRLHLDAQIIFEIQRPIIDTDIVIRAEAVSVVPNDAPHASFPITVSLVLERAQARASDSLPRSEKEQQSLVRDVVAKTFRDKLSLFAYWYQPERVRQEITVALSATLARYAYSLKSLAIDPIVPPAAAEEHIVDVVNFTGRLARPIPFHIESKVRMLQTGAGIYHAQKLPNRKEWMKDQVQAALQSAMHGRDFIDLTAEAEQEVHNTIHERLVERARTIGHDVNTFVASAAIPEKIWLTPVKLQIGERTYKTKNDLVPAQFEIGLVVQFRTLARLEYQIKQYAEQRANDSADGANAAIREAIEKSAVSAATHAMLQIEPAKYFSEYEQWEIEDDGVDSLGRQSGDAKQRNYVRNQLVREIQAELKAVFDVARCEVSPRRVDSRVKTIIKHIESIGDVEVKVNVEPQRSQGSHEAVPIELTFHISSVAPDKWADVIQRGEAALDKTRLGKDIEKWSHEALRDRPITELYELASRQPRFLSVRRDVEELVETRVVKHYGVIVGLKSVVAGFHAVDTLERERTAFRTEADLVHIDIFKRRLQELRKGTPNEGQEAYLLARRKKVQDMINANEREDSDDFARLEQLEQELEKINRELGSLVKTIVQPIDVPRLPERGPPEDTHDHLTDVTPVSPARDTGL